MPRPLLAILLATALAAAEDRVHLDHGGALLGRVVSEGPSTVVLEVGAGRLSIARERIRLIERHVAARDAERARTHRDEWSLVLHGGAVVGWRRVVHTERPGAIRIEERTVFFREGGGEEFDIRRVEVEDDAGHPVEFLHMERYGHRMEVVSGDATPGGALVQIRRDGKLETRAMDLPEGWRLALPAWSRFLASSASGEMRTIRALDPRSLRVQELVMRRQPDRAAPAGADRRPCRAVELASDLRSARAFFRPGEGALAEELNGPTLIAQRTTRERVEMARRAFAPPDPLDIAEVQRHPLQRTAPPPPTSFHLKAGVAVTPPDAGWAGEAAGRDATGRLLAFENVGLFSSFELFAYPAEEEPPADLCLARALRRLRLAASEVTPVGEAVPCTIASRPGLVQETVTRHRGEDLRCLVAVVPARGRYLVALGAAPSRWWPHAAAPLRALLQTVELSD